MESVPYQDTEGPMEIRLTLASKLGRHIRPIDFADFGEKVAEASAIWQIKFGLRNTHPVG